MTGNSLEPNLLLNNGKPLLIPELIALGKVKMIRIGQSAGKVPKAETSWKQWNSLNDRTGVGYE
jgi:hypothetical protein